MMNARCFLLTLALLLVSTTSAFVPSQIPFSRTNSVALEMSTGEAATKIEVVSQPDQGFLEKKGYVPCKL
jgi:hypothetical protein